jgi:TRAP-type C4-dicarboxylate transport system substrate-binding protein
MRAYVRTVATVSTALLGSTGMVGCAVTGDRAGGNREVTPVVLTVLTTRLSGEIQPFVDQVKTLSGGRITLAVTSQWHASDAQADPEAIKAVEAGQSVIGFVPTRAFHDLGVTSFDALGAPLTIDSLALEQRVLGSDLATTMLTGVGALGLHGLGLMPGPMRKPVGLTRKLLAPGDYRGARIAISASAVTARALTTLGATPVASPFNGASMAPYDGLEQQVESVANNQYDTPGSSITANVNLWARPIALFANAKVFDALPASTRALLQKAAVSAIPAATQVQAAAAAEGLGSLCRRGRAEFLDASGSQVAQLRSDFGPVYAWLRGNPETATAIDRIHAMRSGLENAAATETPSCRTSGGGKVQAEAVAPLDGVYTVTTAVGDFRPGQPDPGAENWGAWVYVFSHGRFAITQENADACTWGFGTYAVRGSKFIWDFKDGGGIAPNGATNKPGEHFEFLWSLYRDTLTLTPPPGAADIGTSIAPENFRTKPWHRISTVPTTTMFSPRCPPPAAAFPARTALDGTWSTTFSKAELAASPLLLDQEEINDQNWGTQTLTFASGQYKQNQTNKVTSSSQSGTYAIRGETMFIYQDDGAIFAMRWSIYKNTLSLRRDKALGTGPTPLVLKPWVRVTPSR